MRDHSVHGETIEPHNGGIGNHTEGGQRNRVRAQRSQSAPHGVSSVRAGCAGVRVEFDQSAHERR